MNDSQHFEPQAYQTGPTTPPKSHGGSIAVILVAVIFLSGLARLFSILNIPVMQLEQEEETRDISLLSQSEQSVALCRTPAQEKGIRGQALSDVCRNYYDLPQGTYLTHVDTNSEFYLQGLRSGDILLDVNGKPAPDFETLEKILSETGAPLKIRFFRQGKQHQIIIEQDSFKEGN